MGERGAGGVGQAEILFERLGGVWAHFFSCGVVWGPKTWIRSSVGAANRTGGVSGEAP
jgi:hypothetical protein